jgi:methionyl aminopeptidase
VFFSWGFIYKRCSDIADEEGFTVDEMFCGHGVGRVIHCAPLIQHTRNMSDVRMVPGLVFTIGKILLMSLVQ